jgi:hypothetical protein
LVALGLTVWVLVVVMSFLLGRWVAVASRTGFHDDPVGANRSRLLADASRSEYVRIVKASLDRRRAIR